MRVFLSDLSGLGDDGQPIGTCTSQVTSLNGSSVPLGVGVMQLSSPRHFFDGEMDELRIWAAARQGQQIRAERCCAPTGANLRAYWKFDGGSLLDASGHANTLTNHGATLPAIVPQCQ